MVMPVTCVHPHAPFGEIHLHLLGNDAVDDALQVL